MNLVQAEPDAAVVADLNAPRPHVEREGAFEIPHDHRITWAAHQAAYYAGGPAEAERGLHDPENHDEEDDDQQQRTAQPAQRLSQNGGNRHQKAWPRLM